MSEKYAGLTALQENVVKTKEHVESVRSALDSAKADKFQVTTLPQASESLEGVVLLYIGQDSGSLIQGCFYQCIETPESSPKTYEWENITPKVTTDSSMSISSTNPIQNQAITGGLQALQNGVIVVYASESARPSVVDYASGTILTVGTIGYCVNERTWYKVTAIDSSTLIITWSAYDPHLAGEITAGDGIEIDAQDNNSINVKVDDSTIFVDGTTNEVYGLGHDTSDFDIDTQNKVVLLDATQRTFTGTVDEWDDLTTAQKAKYTTVITTDEIGGGITVVNVIGNNNMNVPTSNAVYRYAQPKVLATPITLNNTTYTNLESLLGAMATILNNGLLTVND